MEDLKKSFLVRGKNIVGFSDKNFSTCPIGTVLSFAGQTAPHGYLLADGASYKVADYPDLYAVIGNTYGGDTENFNVPNLVDKFIQGSTTSGTEKEAGLPNITGGWMPSVPVNYQNYATGAVAAEIKSSGLVSSSGTQAAIGAGFKIDASKSSAVYGNSDTVQPPALTMVYIIKAFHTNEGVDSKNEVSDPIIEYVEGEIAKVDTEVNAKLNGKADKNAVLNSLEIVNGYTTAQIIPWSDGIHYRGYEDKSSNTYTDIVINNGIAIIARTENGKQTKRAELATMDKVGNDFRKTVITKVTGIANDDVAIVPPSGASNYIPINARPLDTWNTTPVLFYHTNDKQHYLHSVGPDVQEYEVEWITS